MSVLHLFFLPPYSFLGASGCSELIFLGYIQVLNITRGVFLWVFVIVLVWFVFLQQCFPFSLTSCQITCTENRQSQRRLLKKSIYKYHGKTFSAAEVCVQQPQYSQEKFSVPSRQILLSDLVSNFHMNFQPPWSNSTLCGNSLAVSPAQDSINCSRTGVSGSGSSCHCVLSS